SEHAAVVGLRFGIRTPPERHVGGFGFGGHAAPRSSSILRESRPPPALPSESTRGLTTPEAGGLPARCRRRKSLPAAHVASAPYLAAQSPPQPGRCRPDAGGRRVLPAEAAQPWRRTGAGDVPAEERSRSPAAGEPP